MRSRSASTQPRATTCADSPKFFAFVSRGAAELVRRTVDAQLAELARRRHGVVVRAQIRALGLARSSTSP
jgi:hypothetical protein